MLDRIIKFSLNNRLLVVAMAALLMVWGVFIVRQIPVDVFPDLNKPTVTIMAESHGLAPEEVETLVTIPIENVMNGLPGVSRVRSTSSIGLSIVWVEFDWSSDLLTNRQLVNEKLTIVRSQIPEDISPQMGPISSLMGEIMLVGLKSKTLKPEDVRTLADWTIRPRLQSVSGVSNVISIGGGVKQVRIQVDLDKLRRFKLSYEEVATAAREVGRNTTGGFVDEHYNEFLIRNIARPTSLEDIEDVVITTRDGLPIRLKNVAEVSYATKVMRGDAGVGGVPGVIMGIQKQPGANTIELTEKIQHALNELKSTLPEDIEIIELFRQATFIETAIENVVEALLDGSIFVAIILFIFLMNFRTTIITLTAIPLSIVITFIVMKFFGIGINTMTLGGLAIAIGELVDDAIVDVENVFRRLRQNKQKEKPQPSLKVVYEASSEVRNSIVLATAIVLLVFIPLMALDGLEGRFFIPLGISYMISIIASLLVSLTVTPALCSYFLPNAKITEREEDGRFISILKRIDFKILSRALDRPKIIIGLCSTSVAVALIVFSMMGKEFLPAFNEGTITAFIVTPPGTSLSESNRVGTVAEKLLISVPEIKVSGRRTGRAEQDEHAEGVYNSEIDVELHPSNRTRAEILSDVRSKLNEIPGVAVSIGQPIAHRLDHMMSGVQAQIAIKVFGEDLSMLRLLAEDVKLHLSSVEGIADLQVERMTTVPQIQISPIYSRLAAAGIAPGHLAEQLEHILSGQDVGEIIQGQKRTVINLRIKEDSRQNPKAIGDILVDSPTGVKHRLSSIAKVAIINGPNAINHENSRRRIIISANTEGRDLGSVVSDIQATIAKDIVFPKGYYVTYDGQFKSQQNATRKIALLSMLSFLGVFFILYGYFGSLFLVMQVLVNIPLALIGSVAAVYLSGGVFSVGTLVGFITLCGIASRNGILLLSHYIYLLENEGLPFNKETIIKGSLERLVPMLMTALTAVLALTPIALAANAPGKEILHPVAVVIVGGLLTSTLLDMIVTPTLFYNYGKKHVEKAIKFKKSKSDQSRRV